MSTVDVEITIQQRGRRRPEPVAAPRIPRITRLMALAIKFQDMIDRGEVRDYADIARLGYVTRARMTQIMNLLNLAPEIQQDLLELASDSPAARESRLRPLAALVDWAKQREARRIGTTKPSL
jgi:hypothetical protein